MGERNTLVLQAFPVACEVFQVQDMTQHTGNNLNVA